MARTWCHDLAGGAWMLRPYAMMSLHIGFSSGDWKPPCMHQCFSCMRVQVNDEEEDGEEEEEEEEGNDADFMAGLNEEDDEEEDEEGTGGGEEDGDGPSDDKRYQ